MSFLNKSNKKDTTVGKYAAIHDRCKRLNTISLFAEGAWNYWIESIEYLANSHKKVYRSTPKHNNYLYAVRVPGGAVDVFLMDNTHDKWCHICWKMGVDGNWCRVYGAPTCSRKQYQGAMVAIDREETDELLRLGGFNGYHDIL